MPIGIVFQGGKEEVDPATRPNVFRIAPTDHGIAFRLAEYLIPKGLKIGLLHDDSDYGSAGGAALHEAFSENASSVALDETLPADAVDLAPQILRARRAHATALIVWGQPATIAAAITAARSAGWNVPFYTPPTGDDPFVRQQLADHPSWVDGLTFAGGRLDRRGRPRAVRDVRTEVRGRLRRRPRRREDARGTRGDPTAGDGDVRLRLRQPARRGRPEGRVDRSARRSPPRSRR